MGGSQHALLYETTAQAVGNIKLTNDCLSYVPSQHRSFHRTRDPTYTKGGRELWDPVIRAFQLDGYLKEVQQMQAVVGRSEEVLAELYFTHFEETSPTASHSQRGGGHGAGQRAGGTVRASYDKLQLGARVSRFASELVHSIATTIVRLQMPNDSQVQWCPRVVCSMLLDLLDVVHLLDVLKEKKPSLLLGVDPDAAGPARGVDSSAELTGLMQAQRFLSSSWAVLSSLVRELGAVQRERGPATLLVLARLLDFTAASLTARDSQQLLVGKCAHVYLRALPVLLHLYCGVSGAAAGLVPEGFDMKLVDRCLALVSAKPVVPGYGDAAINLLEPLLLVPLLATPIRDRDRPKVLPLTLQRDYTRLEARYSVAAHIEYLRSRHNELTDSVARLAFCTDSCRRRLEVPPAEVVSDVLAVCMACMLQVARGSAVLLELDAWRLVHPTLPLGDVEDEQQQQQEQAPAMQRASFTDEELGLVLELMAYVKGMCASLAGDFCWVEPLLHQLAYQEMQAVCAGPLASLIKHPNQAQGLTPQQQKVQELALALQQSLQGLQSMEALLTPAAPKGRIGRALNGMRGKKGGGAADGRASPSPLAPITPQPYDTQRTGEAGGGQQAGGAGKGGMMTSVTKLFRSKGEQSAAVEAEPEAVYEVLRQAPTDRHLQLLQILTEQLLYEIDMSHPRREGEGKLTRTFKSMAYSFNPEVATVVVKELGAFQHLLASLDLLLLLPEMTAQVADLSDLCLSELFIDQHNLPPPHLGDLPCRLAEPALDPAHLLPVDLGLIPLALYRDAYGRVCHWCRTSDLPSLVALSSASYADKFLENAALQAYEHYKAIACQQCVNWAAYGFGTTAAAAGFYTPPVKPCLYDSLLKQQSMELCGVAVNPREQLAFKVQLQVLEDLHRLLDRYEAGKDVTALLQLEFAVRLVRHTHKLLSQHLPLDGWPQTLALVDPSEYRLQREPSQVGSKILAATVPMLLNHLLPLFLYSSHQQRFVPRITPAPSPASPHFVGSPRSLTSTAAGPGFPPDSVQLPLWPFLMAASNGVLDLPDDAPAPTPGYFGAEHVLALLRLVGTGGLAGLVTQIKDHIKGLLQNDIPNQLQQLAACLPPEVARSSAHLTTATGVFSFYNRHLAQVSTQKAIWEEPLKALHVLGNALALLHLTSTALHVETTNNMVQVSPLLGVFAEEFEGAPTGLRCCPPSQPSFFEKLVLGNYAVQVPQAAKAALMQADRRGWGATRSVDLWPKLWSELVECVDGLEARMVALYPASSAKKGPPPRFHTVWSALLWVIIDQEITGGAARQLPYGEGPLWAGCFILHMLQQQDKFKILDFTSMLLKRQQLEGGGGSGGGGKAAAHMHNFGAIAARVMDIWQQVCILAQRLQQPELGADADEAQLPELQSRAIPRWQPQLDSLDPHQAAAMAVQAHMGTSEGPGAGFPATHVRHMAGGGGSSVAATAAPPNTSMNRPTSMLSQLSVPATEDFAQWRPDQVAPSEPAASQVSDLQGHRSDQAATARQRQQQPGLHSAAVVAAFIKPSYSRPAAPEHGLSAPLTGFSPSQPPPSRPTTSKSNAWSRVMHSMVSDHATAAGGPGTRPAAPLTRGPSGAQPYSTPGAMAMGQRPGHSPVPPLALGHGTAAAGGAGGGASTQQPLRAGMLSAQPRPNRAGSGGQHWG